MKNGKAKEISLFLFLQGNMVIIRIEDDGCGFEPEEAFSSRGSGLKNVRNWVQLLHGKFSIDSAIGKGAIVNIKLPLEQA